MIRALLATLLIPGVAIAGVQDVAQNHVETGYATFAQATEALSETAQATCQPEALIPDFHKVFDALYKYLSYNSLIERYKRKFQLVK